jgi:hypothetical protein
MSYHRRRRHAYSLAPVLAPELLPVATPLHRALHEFNQQFSDRAVRFENLSAEDQDQVRRRARVLEDAAPDLRYATAGA